MVLYSIPNLNESFSMEYSIPQIKDSIALIPLFDKKYRISLPDECPNRVTLESKEFLNSAVFVDFNLATVQENITDVTLEIRRNKRSFDAYYETTNTFININDLIEQLYKAIQYKETEIQELKKCQIVVENQTLLKPKNQVLKSIKP